MPVGMRKRLQGLRVALGAKGLTTSDVRLVLALFMFTSLPQKRECLAALDRLEQLSARARAETREAINARLQCR